MQPLNPRLGNAGSIDVMRNPPCVPPGQAQAPYDPTVGEMIRQNIRDMQEQIRRLEGMYLEAREMGILDKKARTIRDIVGW